ncbi:MAG: ribosomal-processing cysteine protease Prp [Treponema sp.]|jgi:uncharacterized protein YsxB (DUF464 family)|nr:ribosomal-processing cysteine protease Prp [Treponema sp.]
MVAIRVVLDETGLLKRCGVQGHAESGPAGGDVVCAAVSVLARTALAVLSAREDIVVRGDAPQRGVFFLEADAPDGPGREFLAAAGAFLLEGLGSVVREYPENCTMTIKKERRD